MKNIRIQRGNPYAAVIKITDTTVSPITPYDLTGKTVFFTMKRPDDNSDNDNSAVIKKNITEHTLPTTAGETTLRLSAEETLRPVGTYKCDIKIYSQEGVQLNSSKFMAELIDIVTKRTS